MHQLYAVEGDVGKVEEHTKYHCNGDVGDDHAEPGGED